MNGLQHNPSQSEAWREIPGFSGYQISDQGRLRSIKGGKIRILNPGIASDGYRQTLLSVNGKKKHFRIHTLVALAFIGPPPHNTSIHHKDHNRTNNHISNLAYKNISDHLSDHSSTLIAAEKAEIRHLYMNHEHNLSKLAELYGEGLMVIRTTLADLSKKYSGESNCCLTR